MKGFQHFQHSIESILISNFIKSTDTICTVAMTVNSIKLWYNLNYFSETLYD